jgi:hypothetical protein
LDPGVEAQWPWNLHPRQRSDVRIIPGVDVMITIFEIFANFRRKKLSFLKKNNVTITIFAKTSSSWSKKTPIFSLNFSAKILKKS